jgi:hypothetical protein
MDNVSTTSNISSNTNTSLFSNKNSLIIILVALLILSLLGINLLTIADNVVRWLYRLFKPIIDQLLYGTGTILNTSTDIVTNATKTGVDIAGGTVHDIGDLLKKAGENDYNKHSLDRSINKSDIKRHDPKPDSTENPIQKPISSGKTNWCLVGEYKNRRGCVEIGERDKCLSGQVFPDQKSCLNPTHTNNMNNVHK